MTDPLKVLHLHFGRDGGAERFFVNLVNGLARRGVEQKTVMRPDRVWRPMIDGSTEIMESHFRNLSLDRLLLPGKVRRLSARWQPDAMLAWTPKGCRLMTPRAGCVLAARLGDYPHALKRFLGVDVLVANTPDIIERMKKLGWSKRTEVISNFTSLEPVAPVSREALGIDAGAHLIVSIGRFVKRKGFDTLLRAVQKMPDAHLVLVGSGEEQEALQALAIELDIAERVQMTGWKSDPRPYIAACDTFVLPSRHEPLGNAVLEAWAQGKPVVATRSEGPSWFMEDGRDGLLVEIGNDMQMAEACASLRRNSDLRRTVIEGGYKTLRHTFSEDAILDQYIALIGSGRRAAG